MRLAPQVTGELLRVLLVSGALSLSLCVTVGFASPRARGARPQAPSSPAATAPLLAEGTISLTRYRAVFAAGPQPLIASIRVYPARRSGRFVGFEIKEIRSGSPLEGGALHVGDVILSVNGAPIGRPADFMRAWERARAMSTLELEIERGGRRARLRWQVRAAAGR